MTAFGRIERALAVQSALNSSGHLGIPSLFIALEIDIVLSPFVSSAISVILFPLNARCPIKIGVAMLVCGVSSASVSTTPIGEITPTEILA